MLTMELHPNIASRFLTIGMVACFAVIQADRVSRSLALALTGILAIIAVGDALTLSRVGWLLGAFAIVWFLPRLRTSRPLRLAMLVFTVSFAVYIAIAPTVLTRASAVAATAITQTGEPDPTDNPSQPTPTGRVIRTSHRFGPRGRMFPRERGAVFGVTVGSWVRVRSIMERNLNHPH